MYRVYRCQAPRSRSGILVCAFFSAPVAGGFLSVVIPGLHFSLLGLAAFILFTHLYNRSQREEVCFGARAFEYRRGFIRKHIPYENIRPHPTHQDHPRFYLEYQEGGAIHQFTCRPPLHTYTKTLFQMLSSRCGVLPESSPEIKALLLSPETSPEQLHKIQAPDFELILENPAMPLFSLENPALYQSLLTKAWSLKVNRWMSIASEPVQRLYGLDCLEHTIGDKLRGADGYQQLQDVLRDIRLFAQGKLSQRKLDAACTGLLQSPQMQRLDRHFIEMSRAKQNAEQTKTNAPDTWATPLRMSIRSLQYDPGQTLQTLHLPTHEDKFHELKWQFERINTYEKQREQ
jgi:hypothetical protein